MTQEPHKEDRPGPGRGRRLAIVAAALVVFATSFALRSGQRSDSEPSPGESTSASEQVATAIPRLVDLGSDKCIPCKRMAPILDEIANEYRGSLVVEFIDVWKDPDAGTPYGIRVIPTQVFFDAEGKERFRHEGFMAKDAILAKWTELGIELQPVSTPREP